MSANNQTLIKEHNGKWNVFTNVMAESWGWDDEKNIPAENELLLSSAEAVCDTRDEAYEKALELDAKVGEWGEGSEYGVQFNRLCKDDSEVKLI